VKEVRVDGRAIIYMQPVLCEVAGQQYVCLLLQGLVQSCARGGRRIVEDTCYEIRPCGQQSSPVDMAVLASTYALNVKPKTRNPEL